MREQLKPVTTFRQLRVGMIVVYKGCNWCGRDHRTMLGNPIRDCFGGLAFEALTPACGTCVGEVTIASGKLYRVVDDLEQLDSEQLWQELSHPTRRPERV